MSGNDRDKLPSSDPPALVDSNYGITDQDWVNYFDQNPDAVNVELSAADMTRMVNETIAQRASNNSLAQPANNGPVNQHHNNQSGQQTDTTFNGSSNFDPTTLSEYPQQPMNHFPEGFEHFDEFQLSEGLQSPHGARSSQGLPPSQGLQSSQGFQPSQGLHSSQGFQPSQGLHSSQGFQHSQWSQPSQGLQPSEGFQPSLGLQSAQGLQSPQRFQPVYQSIEGVFDQDNEVTHADEPILPYTAEEADSESEYEDDDDNEMDGDEQVALQNHILDMISQNTQAADMQDPQQHTQDPQNGQNMQMQSTTQGTQVSGLTRKQYRKKRKLIRWSLLQDQLLALVMEYECNRLGIQLPWPEIARHFMDGASKDAPLQHLMKVRRARVWHGLPIPPELRKARRVPVPKVGPAIYLDRRITPKDEGVFKALCHYRSDDLAESPGGMDPDYTEPDYQNIENPTPAVTLTSLAAARAAAAKAPTPDASQPPTSSATKKAENKARRDAKANAEPNSGSDYEKSREATVPASKKKAAAAKGTPSKPAGVKKSRKATASSAKALKSLADSNTPTPAKRPRGRPRKNPLPAPADVSNPGFYGADGFATTQHTTGAPTVDSSPLAPNSSSSTVASSSLNTPAQWNNSFGMQTPNSGSVNVQRPPQFTGNTPMIAPNNGQFFRGQPMLPGHRPPADNYRSPYPPQDQTGVNPPHNHIDPRIMASNNQGSMNAPPRINAMSTTMTEDPFLIGRPVTQYRNDPSGALNVTEPIVPSSNSRLDNDPAGALHYTEPVVPSAPNNTPARGNQYGQQQPYMGPVYPGLNNSWWHGRNMMAYEPEEPQFLQQHQENSYRNIAQQVPQSDVTQRIMSQQERILQQQQIARQKLAQRNMPQQQHVPQQEHVPEQQHVPQQQHVSQQPQLPQQQQLPQPDIPQYSTNNDMFQGTDMSDYTTSAYPVDNIDMAELNRVVQAELDNAHAYTGFVVGHNDALGVANGFWEQNPDGTVTTSTQHPDGAIVSHVSHPDKNDTEKNDG